LLATSELNRFEDYLCGFMPKFPICADSRDEFKFQKKQPRRSALDLNRWIFYNESWLNLLIFDLDYLLTLEEAWDLCVERVGHEPTWICVTENGVHVAYALENRIAFEWEKASDVAQRIKVAISDLLDADIRGSHRTRGFWRNPLLHIHRASYNEYSLTDFYPVLNEFEKNNLPERAKHIDYLKQHHRNNDVDLEWRVGNRNFSLWYRSMSVTNSKMNSDEIEEIVLNLHYSMSQSLEYYPLNRLEVLRTARSVSKYNRENRNYIGKVSRKKVFYGNTGAMQLPPIRSLDLDEYNDEVCRRQSLSALRTAKMKAKETLNRLKDAVLRLNFLGLSLTQANIALYSDRSKSTVNWYIKEGLLDVDHLLDRICSVSSYIVIEKSLGSVLAPFDLSFVDFNLRKLGSLRWRCFDPPPD
jgi:hypothetical protein